jgi:hypothetical protein
MVSKERLSRWSGTASVAWRNLAEFPTDANGFYPVSTLVVQPTYFLTNLVVS